MSEFYPSKATERLDYLALTKHLKGLQRSLTYSVESVSKYGNDNYRPASQYEHAVTLAKEVKAAGETNVKIVTVLTVRDKGIEVV